METLTLQDIQSIHGSVPPVCSGWVYVSSLAMKTFRKTPLLKRWCKIRISDSDSGVSQEYVMEFYRDVDDLEPTKRIHLSFARVVVSRSSKLTAAQKARMHLCSPTLKPSSNTVAFYIDFPRLKREITARNAARPTSPFFETRSVRADLTETVEDFPLGFIMVSSDPNSAKIWEKALTEGCRVSVPKERKRVRVQRWINRAWLRLRGDLSIDQFDESFRPASIDTEVAEIFFSVSDDRDFFKNEAPLVRMVSQESSDVGSAKSFQTAGDDDGSDGEGVERDVLGRKDKADRFQTAETGGEYAIGNNNVFNSVEEMFSEIDDEIRHSTKISKKEIQSVITYVDSTRQFTLDPSSVPEGWSLCSEGDSFDTFKSFDETTGVVRTRTWAKVGGIPPQTLFFILYNNKARKSWDHHYDRFITEWVDPADPSLDIIDAVVSAPLGCANREFLEWRRKSVPPAGRPERSGKFVIYLRSWSPAGGRPVGRGNVRAEVWLSGYLIKWWVDEDTGRVLGSDVMVMTQIDIKGLIPKYIVNALSSSAPKKWVKGVTAAAQAELEQRGISETALSMTDAVLDSMYGFH